MAQLFDQDLRLLRRDRAARNGPVDFLHLRVFEDMIERLSMVRRTFERVLVLGCPSPRMADAIRAAFDDVQFIEPSETLARHIGTTARSDVPLDVQPGAFDLALSFNSVAEADEPLDHLLRLRFVLADGGLCLGAVVGGDSLPALRAAMRAADAVSGIAAPHVHPRLDPGGLTMMLGQAGFAEPVVDVDRVEIRYGAFETLVADLRAMAATNMLANRTASPLDRAARQAAIDSFAAAASPDGKTTEIIDILHFAGWQQPAHNG